MATKKCIIHCRVSTAKQAYEGESLKVQEEICRNIANRYGWRVAHDPWLEAYSGRKADRRTFDDILKFLDDNPGQVGYYVFRAIDRFTRGGVLFYAKMKLELQQRGVELVDSMGVIQPSRNTLEHLGVEYDWSRIAPSEIAEVVMVTTAKTEVNTILTRLIGQEISLTRQGYKIRQANEGYKNVRIQVAGKKRTIQVPDPEVSRYLIQMYELRAAGQLSDQEIVNVLNAAGYRRPTFNRWDHSKTSIIGRAGGGLLTVDKFQEIIRRPIYCGVLWEKWTDWKPIKAAYAGLVSIETWNQANRGTRFIRTTEAGLELLENYRGTRLGRSVSRHNPEFPFKHVIACPVCKRPLMGSSSRGRSGEYFPAYHCDRGHKRVSRPKATLEGAIANYVSTIAPMKPSGEIAARIIIDIYRAEIEHMRGIAGGVDRNIATLEIEKRQAVEAFKHCTTQEMRDALEIDVRRIDHQMALAHEERSQLDHTEQNVRKYSAAVAELFDRPSRLLDAGDGIQALKARFTRVFVEMPTITEIESGTAKLSPVFSFLWENSAENNTSVRPLGLTWNQIATEMARLNEFAI